MSEKPILFNTEMVRAILDDRKTQTRRVLKRNVAPVLYDDDLPKPDRIRMNADGTMSFDWSGRVIGGFDLKMLYKPGDVLWVRETWHGLKTGNEKFGHHKTFWYKADEEDENPDDKWCPSIHMPKEAARLFLRVKNVRMERLQDMSEEDAISEGYSGVCPGAHTVYFSDGYAEPCHVGGEDCGYGYWYCNHSIQEAFGSDIWDKTIKPADLPRYGWEANPWVWAYEFERCEKPKGWNHG